MSQSPPSSRSPEDDADTREFERFLAGQDPLDAQAAGWMVRRQEGLTPAEEAELRDWLAADPAHGRALDQLEGLWGRMDELPQDGVASLKAGLAGGDVSAAVATRPARPTRRRAWTWDLSHWMSPLAGAAAAAVVIGGAWIGWEAWQAHPFFTHRYATARGQQQALHLPDGSTLWLDTATQVDVALSRRRREVQLPEGQVQLAVQSNPRQPFDVLAGPLRITVVGTRFSVRHTRSGLGEGGGTTVTVEEGRVRVAPQGPGGDGRDPGQGAVELTAGQSIVATAQGRLGPVVQQTAGGGSVWREGRIQLDGATLAQALAEFERYGATHLEVRDPAVAALRVHGSFDLQRLDAFARALPRVLPVKLQPRQDGPTEIVASGTADR